MSTITTTTRTHAYWRDALDDIREVIAQHDNGIPWRDRREIRDDSALAIAAAWASPGTVGRHLATLASTGKVNVEDLLEDIHATYADATTHEDRTALDCLATWSLRHPSRDYSDERA